MDQSAPADTRMMDIAHAALRRDLDRARCALTATPPPSARQGKAIGRHVLWLMDFLHHHHTGEDEGLWPLVLQRDASSAALLDSLEADHARIAPAIEGLRTAARGYRDNLGPSSRAALVSALDQLATVLYPHLDREIEEGMPVVSRAITNGEWQRWNEDFMMKGKSPLELGLEGHFFLDELDEEGRQLVVHLVPPVPRFVLLHAFGWLYRRQSRQRWQSGRASSRLAATA